MRVFARVYVVLAFRNLSFHVLISDLARNLIKFSATLENKELCTERFGCVSHT